MTQPDRAISILVKLALVVFLANILLLMYSGEWTGRLYANTSQPQARDLGASVTLPESDRSLTDDHGNGAEYHHVPSTTTERKQHYSGDVTYENGRAERRTPGAPLKYNSTCDVATHFAQNKQDLFPFKKVQGWPSAEDFLCEPELGRSNKKTLLIFVESAPSNFLKRSLIRRTWASAEYYRKNAYKTSFAVVVIFVVGIPNTGGLRQDLAEVTTDIKREMEQYRDVLVINMSDHYDHLTYKGIAALTWIRSATGPAVTHIFKTDDDSFVNVMGWMTIIIRLKRVTESEVYIVGTKCVYHSAVVRDRKLRPNPVKLSEYPKRYYPPYCMGSGYLMSRPAMLAMLRVIPGVPFLRVEDVFFTGLVAIAANITRYWTSSTTERDSVQLIHTYNGRNMPLIVHHLSNRPKFWHFLWFMNKAAYERSVLDWNKYPVRYFAGPRAGINRLD